MATEDARYRQSTQYRLWSFSPSQLSELRTHTNSLAKASITDRLSASSSSSSAVNTSTSTPAVSAANTPNPSADPSSSSTAVADHAPGSSSNKQPAAAPGNLPEFLTPAEEAQLLKFYTVELLRAAAFCELPTDIQATSAVFLRRFYLTNSIMTYPPTDMLKTALFFGSKAEGYYTRLKKFADNFPNTTAEQILAGEFLLCQGIRFAFDVKHPFRGLEGAIMDLRRYGDVDENRINAAHKRARAVLKFSSLVTDVYFHYTPSQIMLGALSLADHGLVERILHETFKHTHTHEQQPQQRNGDEMDIDSGAPAQGSTTVATAKSSRRAEARREKIGGADVRDKILASVKVCRDMLAVEPPERFNEYWGTPESNNIIKPLIRKLKKCRDPDRWDLVALQKAKMEAAYKKGIDKAGGSSGEAEDDVFGGGLGSGPDAKRRKVGKVPDDPFGPALKG